MALLQDLIQQIDDPALKERILQETNKLWRIVKLSATPLRNRPHMVFCSQGTS